MTFWIASRGINGAIDSYGTMGKSVGRGEYAT